jgi:predicted MFS family arabinose efflux permease
MRIAKPLLLIITPLGVAIGLYEAWRLAGGLVFLMAALLGVVTVAMLSVVRTIRREQAMERKKAEEDAAKDTSSPPSPGPVAR